LAAGAKFSLGVNMRAIQTGCIAGIVFAFLVAWSSVQAQLPPEPQNRQPTGLRDLVSSKDGLASQDLIFDASFAQLALVYLKAPDPAILDQLAKSSAAAHLLSHARNFDYDVPKDSPAALISYLLTPPAKHQSETETCQRSLAFFSGSMLNDPHWVQDTLRYLPDDFHFHGALFLTFGYDIGVAFGPTASLNCAHPHFKEHPRELLYYAIHELHHVGFMSYHPPPKLSDIKTCADLLGLVEYSTQLEGMAVFAAYQRRSDEHALADDNDYVALQDEQRMQRDEQSYFDDLNYLKGRGKQPADADAWAVIHRMSSGERLWYRVGARMAQRIEQASGRSTLLDLVRKGPSSFLEAYETLKRPDGNKQDGPSRQRPILKPTAGLVACCG